MVRGHHADAAVVLVATPLGILYVANIAAHSDGFNFLQVSHADGIQLSRAGQIEFASIDAIFFALPADTSSSHRAG